MILTRKSEEREKLDGKEGLRLKRRGLKELCRMALGVRSSTLSDLGS